MKIIPGQPELGRTGITVFISGFWDLGADCRCGKELGLRLLPFC